MRKSLLAVIFTLCSFPALAASTTSSVNITITSPAAVPLAIAFTPAAPSKDCTTSPAGTLVATLSTTGGNGAAVTWSALTGDTADFALSGNTIIVGPSGLTCPVLPAVSKTVNVGVTASQ